MLDCAMSRISGRSSAEHALLITLFSMLLQCGASGTGADDRDPCGRRDS
jgi:hypothetical protein